MIPDTSRIRTVWSAVAFGLTLLVAVPGTASAQRGGMMGGTGVGGSGWVGSGMVLWPLLFLGSTILVVWALDRRTRSGPTEEPLDALRNRYARGEISDEEFESRRATLERRR